MLRTSPHFLYSEISPQTAVTLYNMGNALLDLGRAEEAVQSVDRAIRLKADFAAAYNTRGQALLDLNLPERALESCNRALILEDDFVAAHCGKGIALLDLRRAEEAIESYDRAIVLSWTAPIALGIRR